MGNEWNSRALITLMLPWAIGLSPLGCWGNGYDITVRFVEDEQAERAAAVEVDLVSECPPSGASLEVDPDDIRLSMRFRTTEASPSFGSIAPGSYGLLARIRDESCAIIAVGCLPVELEAGGEGTLTVSVEPSDGPACVSDVEVCDTGLCESTHTDRDADTDADSDTCIPSCLDRFCGDDDCGGECPPGCDDGQACDAAGHCFAQGSLVPIPAGFFMIGSPMDEVGRDRDEDQFEATLTRDFSLLSTEVTCEEFKFTMESVYDGYVYPLDCSPCSGCPVRGIAWSQAAAYCNALSELDELERCYDCDGPSAQDLCRPTERAPYDCSGYRLPTEAEWEYAARAGTITATFVGESDERGCVEELSQYAWYDGSSCSDGPSPYDVQRVGQTLPNPWGLWDMLGNVEEWCHDQYDTYPTDPTTDPLGPDQPEGSNIYHVTRGGHYGSRVDGVRSANRYSYNSSEPASLGTVGFRVARTSP